jgi:adenylate cyclase
VSSNSKRIALTLAAAAVVAAACWFALGHEAVQRLDRRITLSSLYAARGERTVPDSVVVIEMNAASGARMSLPAEAHERSRCEQLLVDDVRPGFRPLASPEDETWPRCVHAQLVDSLRAAGARTIVFDVAFAERRGRDKKEQEDQDREDVLLAEAMRRAGNVLIADRVAYVPCKPGTKVCEERGPKPLSPILRDSAAATGPMLLEHASGDLIDSFMLFREGAEPMVALPMLAWHFGRLEAHDQLAAWLATLSPSDAVLLPRAGVGLFAPGELVGAGLYFRAVLRELGPRAANGSLSGAAVRMRELYAGPGKLLLNEYGPARVLRSLAYADALKLAKPDTTRLAAIVSGKTVFIGYAERHEKGVLEQFPTHFSSPTEVDPSGVDLLATAYANLADASTLRPKGSTPAIGAVAGFVGTIVCLVLPAFWGLGVVVLGLLAYGTVAVLGFTGAFRVLPLVAPIAGAALGFTVAITTQYFVAARQRRRVFDRLCQFVPPEVARRLAQPSGIVPESVQGVCLVTDATGYTSLAERTESDHLAQHLNRYFEILFRPVIDNGGFVSDVIGDSMLAVWPHRGDSAAPIGQVLRACLAMLNELDHAGTEVALSTRIGVAAGPMTLTLVGALTHFEYRAVGDMVNATNRVQALNKLLGTRVLVRAEVAQAAPDFIFRDLGVFQLVGKAAPERIFELVGHVGAVDENRLRFVASFESARRLVELGDVDGAKRRLEALAETHPTDGPTRHYLDILASRVEPTRRARKAVNR